MAEDNFNAKEPEWFTPEDVTRLGFTLVEEIEPANKWDNSKKPRELIGQKTYENAKVWQTYREKWAGWSEPEKKEERIYIVSEEKPNLPVAKKPKEKFPMGNTSAPVKLPNIGGGRNG